MLEYSYAGRVIHWSDRIRDRYIDDEFSRELRVEVAVRLTEEQWVRFRRLAPAGASWSLHLGEVAGIDASLVAGYMAACEEDAAGALEEVERAAAAAILRRQGLLAAETARVNSSSSGPRWMVIDTVLTWSYARPHDQRSRNASSASGTAERCHRRFNVNRQPTKGRRGRSRPAGLYRRGRRG